MSEPKTIYLKNYQAPDFFIKTVDITFDIVDNKTTVTAISEVEKNKDANSDSNQLVLQGEELKLIHVQINNKDFSDYKIEGESLILNNLPESFTLKIINEIEPDKNTALQGLYRSGDILCTQNEAEGFRRITYFLDRPDVMATYTTTIIADERKYPILLSNGNLIEKNKASDGRHSAKWHDPHPKPSYLFALVAGDLGKIEDSFTTKSGKKVKLEIYVDHGDESKATHAMESLKQSMKWDEEVYGLEYDLDVYMITSVHSFNSGAMENKGLNIFNSKLVLADTETATDQDYHNIQSVIGHEYFHNWTGNRVTCRDWFQLSLKEGLTVFRDQEFSSDMTSRAVCRINDVNRLRTNQFAEDSGPMAHPVRPQSYIEIDNFYTLTVYEKGAEVVRMIHTLLGAETFRKGIDKYFELFDGQAVTTDDFVHAMEQASGKDLTQFKRWYDQAGTPEISFQSEFKDNTYTLHIEQTCPETPGQKEKLPFHIPISVGLLDSQGQDMIPTQVLELKQQKQSFEFENIKQEPVLSLLRNFSAPVKVKTPQAEQELLFLMAHDSDAFVKWEAGQKLALKNWYDILSQIQNNKELSVSKDYIQAFDSILENKNLDAMLVSQLLALPDYEYAMQGLDNIIPSHLHTAIEFIYKNIASTFGDKILTMYNDLNSSNTTAQNSDVVGQRQLRNQLLGILSREPSVDINKMAYQQYDQAENMTVRMGALNVLKHQDSPEHQKAFKDFYQKFHNDTLTIDKWFQLQASSRREDTLEKIKSLENDPAFNIKVPNKCYSLFWMFGRANPLRFHDESGAAYQFYADKVLQIDKLNPSVAARIVGVFNNWKHFEPTRREHMRQQLECIKAEKTLSKNTYEIVSKALN